MHELMQQREGAAVGCELAIDADDRERLLSKRKAEHFRRLNTGHLEHKHTSGLNVGAPPVVALARITPTTLLLNGDLEQCPHLTAKPFSGFGDLNDRQLPELSILLGRKIERQIPALARLAKLIANRAAVMKNPVTGQAPEVVRQRRLVRRSGQIEVAQLPLINDGHLPKLRHARTFLALLPCEDLLVLDLQ